MKPKHLLPYLPYNLEFYISNYENQDKPFILVEAGLSQVGYVHDLKVNKSIHYVNENKIKPLLIPMNEINNEIEIKVQKFVPIYEIEKILKYNFSWCEAYEAALNILSSHPDKALMMPYSFVEILLSWHFDVFGLIDQGLASVK